MIHVYHGKGKGKTTAAMGLALRAAGAGKRVVIVQFLKGRESGEVAVLRSLPGVVLMRGKNTGKFSCRMDEAERAAAWEAHAENLAEALRLVEAGQCDLLVLDEALGALNKGLLARLSVESLLGTQQEGLELVFTGREPPAFLLEAADYITEMCCERHPFEKGVHARRGVEF